MCRMSGTCGRHRPQGAGDTAGDFGQADPLVPDDAVESGDSGNFDGLDINAVDFSEPAAETPSDDGEAEAEPLPDGDTLKPGTFS